jgi:hypothetical protein
MSQLLLLQHSARDPRGHAHPARGDDDPETAMPKTLHGSSPCVHIEAHHEAA